MQLHLFPVHTGRGGLDTELASFADLGGGFRGAEQGLGRHAAGVQAVSAHFAFLIEYDRQAELCCAGGSGQAGRACADHNEIGFHLAHGGRARRMRSRRGWRAGGIGRAGERGAGILVGGLRHQAASSIWLALRGKNFFHATGSRDTIPSAMAAGKRFWNTEARSGSSPRAKVAPSPAPTQV